MDYAVRALDSSGNIRAFAAVTTDMVNRAADIHRCSATAAAALGRSLTAASMLGLMLKDRKNKLTLQIKGGGPIGKIVVVANAMGAVKGYADNPRADLPIRPDGKLDVGGVVGKDGYLTVIKDLGLKEPYIGQVQLLSGEIGEDMAAYFTYSEQVPSAVALGVLVGTDLRIQAAGGYMLQIMAGAGEETIAYLEKRLGVVKPVSTMVKEGYTPEKMLEYILQDRGVRILEKTPIMFKCDCSKERLEEVIVSLGEEEIRSIIEKEGQAEVVCHFCNQKYIFNRKELGELLYRASTGKGE